MVISDPEQLLFAIGSTRPGNGAVALIIVDGQKYLMQKRSLKAGIYFPGYWGLFGGAAEPDEDLQDTLYRELYEELGFKTSEIRYFTEIEFDFSYIGCGRIVRRFFEVNMTSEQLAQCVLGEGDGMYAFTAQELFREPKIVPYDAFAIWMHAVHQQQS